MPVAQISSVPGLGKDAGGDPTTNDIRSMTVAEFASTAGADSTQGLNLLSGRLSHPDPLVHGFQKFVSTSLASHV